MNEAPDWQTYVPKILSHQKKHFKPRTQGSGARNGYLLPMIVTVALVAFALFLTTLKFDYDRENDAAMQYFSSQPDMSNAFAELESLPQFDAVVLCLWDYGRAVKEWSHREVIEAYPSREIAQSVGSTRSFWGNLEAQLLAKWGSHEKIKTLPERSCSTRSNLYRF